MLKIIFVLLALGLVACSSEQCNNIPQRPPASDGAAPTAAPMAVPIAQPIPKDAIQVFKATGEKQCQKGTAGIPLDEMQGTLTLKKVTVYESHTQSDGKMHMQLCGSPAGTIHVFTISKKDLKSAEKLGFKVKNPN